MSESEKIITEFHKIKNFLETSLDRVLETDEVYDEMIANMRISKFWCYVQNNSHGSWVRDKDNDKYVIIEADSYNHANMIAEEEHGLYFDGFGDCRCCGRRWSEQEDWSDASSVPMVWGDILSNIHDEQMKKDNVVIHYLSGKTKYAKY
jgi:hypothetical protein